MNNFRERLASLLNGRKLYSWAKSIGFTAGTVERMSKGHMPAAESLAKIYRAENVSLTWLTTGKGQPFFVAYAFTDKYLVEWLINHIEDEFSQWYLVILTDGSLVAYVLYMPGQWVQKEKCYDYTVLQMTTGKSGEASRNYLTENTKHLNEIRFGNITQEEMKELSTGQWGTYKLFGDDRTPGIVYAKGHLIDNPVDVIPETAYEKDAVSFKLMNAVIKMITEASDELGIEISKEQYGKLITSVYRYAQRSNLTADNIDKNAVIAIIETI